VIYHSVSAQARERTANSPGDASWLRFPKLSCLIDAGACRASAMSVRDKANR
jgi:hypothetical protein